MRSYIAAFAVIFGLFLGWVVVQFVARAFARRNPGFGPAREEGGGCGKTCLCAKSERCRLKEP